MTELPERLAALLERPSPCLLATVNPDGSPQLTQTWVDTDSQHILINTVQGHRKLKNIERDPRVAVSILDPDDTASYYSVRGTVTSTTTDGARDSIERLSRRYTGGPYRSYSGNDAEVRVLITIRVDAIINQPWG
jgi:PPOX class probable F420-dependent enzyme